MAVYPSVIDSFPSPAGTNTLNSPDHASLHGSVSTQLIAVENTVGTTGGTNVLKNFTAADLALRHRGGTIQDAINGGTFNNVYIPEITDGVGGTILTVAGFGANANYVTFVNSSSGTGYPIIEGNGTATNIGINFLAVGTGQMQIMNFAPYGLWDGWVSANETWTYASSSTFKVSADVTAKYQFGDTIKCTQGGTVEYFYITATPAVASGTTTLTVLGDSGTPLANAAISSNFYSKNSNPQGFPNIMNYAGTNSGWSGLNSSTFKYRLTGRLCNVVFDVSGTSNQTFAIISGPINATQDFFEVWAYATDNGSGLTSPGNVQVVSGTNTINIYKQTSNSSTWTNSGAKRIIGNLDYIV